VNTKGSSLGAILEHLYMSGVFSQPNDSEPRSYLDQIRLIIDISLIMNTIFQFPVGYLSGMKSLDAPNRRQIAETMLTRRKSLEEVLGLTVPQLYHLLHVIGVAPRFSVPSPKLDSSQDPTFRPKDLNIESLRGIGGLSIEWTEILENHLALDLGTRRLYVRWQELAPRRSPMGEFERQ
jgi:hypothetical protein